ncbi:hypothetical protein C2G38_2039253 [Gigaspora rosea]|uniref:Uncharacterized protein n=1 Tax=Gigaspora rosea TaxID=44941 RepID=A0A397V1W0_9GLOM|nr:hypothetical protein C2G38_2039253 [Gigaspora rosea]
MYGFDISIILDKKDRTLPKPFNNHPGYDMKYVMAYCLNYTGYGYEQYVKLFATERLYDNLSIVRLDENLIQWAVQVKIDLQDLLLQQKFSVYHRFCLFAFYPGGKLEDFNYYHPKPFKNGTAICFGCWKVICVNVNVKPKKKHHFSRGRYVKILEPKDLILEHWDRDCFRPKTDFGYARIIQKFWRSFKEKKPSNARLAWNSLANNNTSDDKKFLGLTQHKVKNSQTREQFNQWHTKWIELYKNNPMMCSSIINRQSKEYYISDNWIECKKSQLLVRFQKRLLEIQ